MREVAKHMREKFTPEERLRAAETYFGLEFPKKDGGTKEKGKPMTRTASKADDFFRDFLLPKHYQ